MQAGIVFPNQLFEKIPFSESCKDIYLVEEHLFFKKYPFINKNWLTTGPA